MKFSIFADSAGCNAKIDFRSIERFQSIAGSSKGDDNSVFSFEDDEIVVSIDKVGRFCSDLDLFAEAALRHAMRDIVAGRATPHSADVSFEFGPELDSDESRDSLVLAVVNAFQRVNICLGKCHSVAASSTALVLAARGTRSRVMQSISRGGSVLLAGRLGAYKALYLSELGHTEIPRSAAIEQMLASPEIQLARLGGIRDCTDVSGFGFAGAIASLASRNEVGISCDLHAELWLEADRLLPWPIECLVSDIPKSITFISSSPEIQSAVATRELAGPMLLLCDERVSGKDAVDMTVIGEWSSETSGVQIRWS